MLVLLRLLQLLRQTRLSRRRLRLRMGELLRVVRHLVLVLLAIVSGPHTRAGRPVRRCAGEPPRRRGRGLGALLKPPPHLLDVLAADHRGRAVRRRRRERRWRRGGRNRLAESDRCRRPRQLRRRLPLPHGREEADRGRRAVLRRGRGPRGRRGLRAHRRAPRGHLSKSGQSELPERDLQVATQEIDLRARRLLELRGQAATGHNLLERRARHRIVGAAPRPIGLKAESRGNSLHEVALERVSVGMEAGAQSLRGILTRQIGRAHV